MNSDPTSPSELSSEEILALAIKKTEEELQELEDERKQILERQQHELFQMEAKLAKKRRQLTNAHDGQLPEE